MNDRFGVDKQDGQKRTETPAAAGGRWNYKPEEAMLQIKTEPYKEMGFAKLDTHRKIRSGFSEVIFAVEKLMNIFSRYLENYMRKMGKFLEQELQKISMI